MFIKRIHDNKIKASNKVNFSDNLSCKLFLFLFFSLFSFSIVSAVPPTTIIFMGDYGINVEVNIMETYKFGEPRWTVIHLSNSTSGYQLTPVSHDNITCHMHLRDSQGFEIMKVEAETNLEYWYLNGSGGGNNPTGNYAWTISCQDGTNLVGGYASGYFEITPDGLSDKLGFYFLILILSLGIIAFGISIRDPTVTILGSFGLYFVGLYILYFGIDGFKDPIYTWAIGLIVLMLAAYISIRSAYELITD